ncbi:MAG: hypothetical protein K8F92_15625 [Hyphomicrobium sp.]|uniref:hypothetical protein n=1 Tax=Hyphomicrobium sp. TaxID=82 RepID=UPI0025BCE653|nr:hypothetical protein [Hyphomicrobium sp.]MBZ0211060.1 hypothetical protein [Hyphomicrobium sp.]
MQKHIGKAAAKLVNAPLKTARPRFNHEEAPEKFTYALAAHTAERRKDGWYVAKTMPSFANEKPKWTGPFIDIENACLSIARQLFVELADRHTRAIETHAIARTDPLYGLKPTTKLRPR